MNKKIALLIPIFIIIGVVILGFKEFTQFNQISDLKKKKPKAIVVKNLKVDVKKYLQTNKNDVPIYESLDGKLIIVATLSKGQEVNSTEDHNPKWYEVRIGNNYGMVSKNDATLSTNTQHLKDDLNKNAIIKDYLTLNKTPVYSDYKKPYAQIATLEEEVRYPMSVLNKDWLTIDIAGKIGNVKRVDVKLDSGIPVLMYHHLLEKKENKNYRNTSTTITPETFNQQMNYLYQQHFSTITTEDLEGYLTGKMILPQRTVVITFDDGLQSVYRYAYPILKRYHLKATEFMITGRIVKTPFAWNPNKANPLSYPEMDKMKDVFEFNSHTNNLHNLNKHDKSDVVTKPASIVKADIALSQKIVHAQSLAYPFGQFNQQTIQILQALGFKCAFTTNPGYAKIGDNPYEIPRIAVTPKVPLRLFKYLVN